MSTLRLLSYNVRSLRDDPAAVSRVIRACAPDVVCLQEAPRFARWRTKRADLARRSGLFVAAGERAAGLAIFTSLRARVLSTEHYLLSPVPRLHRRGLAVAVLDIAGAGRIVAACTHLDLDPGPRRRHAEELLALLARIRDVHEAPVVLAADVNEGRSGPTWTLLAERLQDCYAATPDGDRRTYSARAPQRTIDGIFADRRLRVISGGVPDLPDVDLTRASDHRPVLAEIALTC